MQYTHVSFDIADQSFKFYTQLEWHNLVADARNELYEEYADEDPELAQEAASRTVEDLLECIYGDEFFWEQLPC